MQLRGVNYASLLHIHQNNKKAKPMNLPITHNDLMRYAYNETTVEENRNIQQELEKNWQLKEAYHSLLLGQTVFDLFEMRSPSKSSVQLILEYSRRLEELQTTC